jgi:hypothetical protein
VIEDHGAAVAKLRMMWTDHPPATFNGKQMVPLLGSAYDQDPEGINPYWEIVRHLPLDRHSSLYEGSGHAIQVDGYACRIGREYLMSRDQLTKTYAWAIPTPDDIRWLTTVLEGRSVVEIGAGTGYWAWQLAQFGVDVLAFDEFPGESNTYCCSTATTQAVATRALSMPSWTWSRTHPRKPGSSPTRSGSTPARRPTGLRFDEPSPMSSASPRRPTMAEHHDPTIIVPPGLGAPSIPDLIPEEWRPQLTEMIRRAVEDERP